MVLKVTSKSLPAFAYGTVTLYGPPFLKGSASRQIYNSFGVERNPRWALQPRCHIGPFATQ